MLLLLDLHVFAILPVSMLVAFWSQIGKTFQLWYSDKNSVKTFRLVQETIDIHIFIYREEEKWYYWILCC